MTLILQRSDVFDKGAFVSIEYITGEEDAIPFSLLSGTVVSAEEDLLIVDAENRPEEFHIDLTKLSLDVKVTIPYNNYDSSTVTLPGTIQTITLLRVPWEDDCDEKRGLELRVDRSEYDWISEGPFLYPSPKYFARESPPSPNRGV